MQIMKLSLFLTKTSFQKEQLNDNYCPNTMVKRSLGTKEILVPGTVRWPESFGGGDGIGRMWGLQWWNPKDWWVSCNNYVRKNILVEGGMEICHLFFWGTFSFQEIIWGFCSLAGFLFTILPLTFIYSKCKNISWFITSNTSDDCGDTHMGYHYWEGGQSSL